MRMQKNKEWTEYKMQKGNTKNKNTNIIFCSCTSKNYTAETQNELYDAYQRKAFQFYS